MRTKLFLDGKPANPDVTCAAVSCRPGVFSEICGHVLRITACG